MKSRGAAATSGKVLVLVDESNVVSSVRTSGRNLDWLKLQEHLAEATGCEMLEMVVYVGLPPAMPEWHIEREKKSKFVHWLRSHGFLVVTKDGSPADEGHYKANVDVIMAIDAIELATEMRPDKVVLVTGDSDFGPLALHMRRRGIRVAAASIGLNLGSGLKTAVNDVIDLAPLFASFDMIKGRDD